MFRKGNLSASCDTPIIWFINHQTVVILQRQNRFW